MSVEFKKGSIVPRRIGLILAQHKAAQHYLVFGTNVTFDGKTLTHSSERLLPGESLILCNNGMSAPRKNGTRRKSGWSITNWTVVSVNDEESGVHRTSLKKGNQE